jgi:pSer/pThr/pTyr-binding forkhead associated (FHA) protein
MSATSERDPLAQHSLSPIELKQVLEAEGVGTPFVVLRDERGALGVFEIGRDGQTVTVGRRPDMDLAITWDDEVSGLHAELHRFGGEWTIADDGLSTNGTFLNGKRVTGRERLRDGDRIRLGRTTLAFKAGRSVQVQRTAAAGDGPAVADLTPTQRRVLIALCRPYRDEDEFATPASNQQIAAELFLSLDAVKMHLRRLFIKFALTEMPQNEKRARLAESVLQFGVISRRELD